MVTRDGTVGLYSSWKAARSFIGFADVVDAQIVPVGVDYLAARRALAEIKARNWGMPAFPILGLIIDSSPVILDFADTAFGITLVPRTPPPLRLGRIIELKVGNN